jgi:hypothetical protein
LPKPFPFITLSEPYGKLVNTSSLILGGMSRQC